MTQHIFLFDYLLFPIYTIILYLIVKQLSKTYQHPDLRRYFIWGFWAKVFGGFMLAMVYEYYYNYGDTFIYFSISKRLQHFLLHDATMPFWEKLTIDGTTFSKIISVDYKLVYNYTDANMMVVRLCTILNFFTFQSFLVNTLLFTIISYSGIWKLYLVFVRLFPKLYKEFAFSILFFPSVIFWGSGLLKDTLCIGAIGWLVWSVYHIFLHSWKKQSFFKLLLAFISIYISFYIIRTIKIYIVMSFVPAILIWLFFFYKDKIKNKVINFLMTPIAIVVTVFSIIWGLSSFSEQLGEYALENIVETAVNLNYNLQKTESGSTYDIGTIDPSISGVLSKAPQAINVTLFRPYLWEARNPIILIAALESLGVFCVTLYVFYSIGFFKTLKVIASNNIVLFCFIYSIIFSFAVGLTASNFGTLVRYKIPAMPFYFMGISILYFIGSGGHKISDKFGFWRKKKTSSAPSAPVA